jgi:hypothetical protein
MQSGFVWARDSAPGSGAGSGRLSAKTRVWVAKRVRVKETSVGRKRRRMVRVQGAAYSRLRPRGDYRAGGGWRSGSQ